MFNLKLNYIDVSHSHIGFQIKDYGGLSVDLLVPGTMVNARVQAILHNGLLLSFLTYFTGTVSALCVCV